MSEPVEFGDTLDHFAAILVADALRVREVEDRIALGLELHALVFAWQEAVVPVTRRHGLAAAGEQDEERRQVGVLAAEPVAKP